MTQEALKLALDALKESRTDNDTMEFHDRKNKAIAVVEKALAQTQEPEYAWPTVADYERDVGFQTNEAFRMAWVMARTTNKMLGHLSPPQRTWVGLTDEEVRDLWSWSATSEAEKTANTQQHAFARAIEAKLKEKNT